MLWQHQNQRQNLICLVKLNVLYVSYFSSEIGTRETQCMLLIDPGEHDSTKRCKLEEKQGEN